MAEVSLQRLGTSIPVDNVQALATSVDADSCCVDVPQRYIRQEAKADPVAGEGDGELPVIDFSRLLDQHFYQGEAAKLHRACVDWGFFQARLPKLINHGIPSGVTEKIKADVAEFFTLPLDVKNAFAQRGNSIEGYGQAFVVSDDQKLDWGDMFYLVTRPIAKRNMASWPTQPATFRDTLSRYSLELKRLASILLEIMAKNLGLTTENFSNIFHGQPQGIRINYYPPCPKADEVLGISAHTDGSGLTLLLHINDAQGLQIKNEGTWYPVKPLPGALIGNIGDVIEMLSNGEYKSMEHRAIINADKERISLAAFHGPREDTSVGPLPELVKKGCEAKYRTVCYRDYTKALFSSKLHGRSLLESFQL